jgi:hypothetical protein
MTYEEFIPAKLVTVPPGGFDVSESELPEWLFPFQKRIASWMIRQGRCAAWTELRKP